MEKLIRDTLTALRFRQEMLWKDFKELDISDRDEAVDLMDSIKELDVQIELLERIIFTYENNMRTRK